MARRPIFCLPSTRPAMLGRGVIDDALAVSRTVLVLPLPGHREALHDLHRVAGEKGEVGVLLEHLCRGLV